MISATILLQLSSNKENQRVFNKVNVIRKKLLAILFLKKSAQYKADFQY